MPRKDRSETEQKQAWSATKVAVRHYARNPCRATEVEVETAVHRLRDLQATREPIPAVPKPRKPK